MTTRTHTNPARNVLLLRTPAEGGLDDFEDAFNAHGYLPISVPVLKTIFVNVADLSSKIAAGPQNQSLSGVIVTSKRGLEAWSNAVESIASDDPGLVPGDSGEFEQRISSRGHRDWHHFQWIGHLCHFMLLERPRRRLQRS